MESTIVGSIAAESVAGSLILTATGPVDAGNKLPSTAAPSYPPVGDTGPFPIFPSEGMYIVDLDINAGAILGKSRRVGNGSTNLMCRPCALKPITALSSPYP